MSKATFDPISVLKTINSIEARFPVSDWEIEGLRIWPYLRTALAYTQNQNLNTRQNVKAGGGRVSKYKRMVRYGLVLLKLPFQYVAVRGAIRESRRIFVGAPTYRISIDGISINKHFDASVQDFARQGERSVIFDNSLNPDKERTFNGDRLFSLPSLYMIPELLKRFGLNRGSYKVNLDRYDEVYAYVLENFEHTDGIRKHFKRSDIVRRIESLYERKEFLKKLISGSQIQSAYFLCYYSSLLYPLLAACNELNIPTADIQHGGIGGGHYAYDKWTKHPASGYALLPRYFWTWDPYTATLINNWAGSTSHHKAISMGNSWTTDSLRFYKSVPDVKDYVLLNMTEITLDEFLVETILHYGKDRTWMLRMHPRHYQHRAVLEEQVRERGLGEYVKLEDPLKVPLPVSLSYCRWFISKASGSVIEAVELGIKPILLRSKIVSYYDHYIRENKVVLPQEETSRYMIALLDGSEAAGRVKAAAGANENKFTAFEKIIADKLT